MTTNIGRCDRCGGTPEFEGECPTCGYTIQTYVSESEVDRLAHDLAGDWKERAEKAEAEITVWKTRLVEQGERLRAECDRLRAENDALQMKLDYAVAKVERYRGAAS